MTKILCIPGKEQDFTSIVQALHDLEFPCHIYQTKPSDQILQKIIQHQPHLIFMHQDSELCKELIQNQKEGFIPFTPLIILIHPDEIKETSPDWQSDQVDYICLPVHPSILIKRIQIAQKLSSLQEAIHQQKNKLEDMQVEQNYLMSIVAHDLKSPLNKVLGLIQLMPMVGELNKEQESCVKMVNKVIGQGRKLIDDLLTINAYEAQLDHLELEWIDVNAFIAELQETYDHQAQEKNIKLEWDIEQNLRFSSEQESLSRILDNLLSNALKFSKAHTQVQVKVSYTLDHILQIMVRDQGPGIHPQDQSKMFKKFQTLSAKPTGGESSTGLGLSIIKALVNKLKGEIKFDSKVGEGTAFYVALPHLSKK